MAENSNPATDAAFEETLIMLGEVADVASPEQVLAMVETLLTKLPTLDSGGAPTVVKVQQNQLAALIAERRQFKSDLVDAAINLEALGKLGGGEESLSVTRLPMLLLKLKNSNFLEVLGRIVVTYHPNLPQE